MTRRSPLLRIAGLLLILSGLLLNHRALGAALATDEEVTRPLALVAILLMQAVLALAGLWLLLRPPRGPVPAFVGAPLLLALAGVTGFGAWAEARYREWVQPRIRQLPELCECWSKRPESFPGAAKLTWATANLKRAEATSKDSVDTVEWKTMLGDFLLRDGQNDKATQILQQALESAKARSMPVHRINQIRRWLGVANMRVGEVQHCIRMHGAESCLFPISKNAVWQNKTGAFKAMEYFRQFLQDEPGDPSVRWMLNVANMIAGTYPEGVPPSDLIPPSVYASSEPTPRFREIASSLGIAPVQLAGGAIVDDFDNDGFLDIVVSTFDPCTPLSYFHNDGNGSFSDWTAKAGLEEQTGGFNIGQTDFNNDGLLDIYVKRGAWLRTSGRMRDSLLRQNPDGTFTDVTDESGLGAYAYPDISAEWADYDNDGDLDLYVGGEMLTDTKWSPSQLFRNNGDGTFTEVARQAGVLNMRNVKGIAWGDYDNDGDQDLYVSNLGQPNRLYRNNGDGTFTDVGPELGVAEIPPFNRTFATWFFDANNDGWLDIYVGGYAYLGGTGLPDISLVAADYLGMPTNAETLHVFLNDGTGHFHDASERMNLNHVRAPMGANYGDIDNDGYPDIYLATGGPAFDLLVPNILYRNIGGEYFSDVTTAANVGHLQKGHGVAFGDIDNDGDQDIYVQMGGIYRSDVTASALFENPGTSNHWLTVKLVGVKSNRPGVGARIKLIVNEHGKPREIHAVGGSGGSFGSNSFQQEIGVGAAECIEEIEVWWPASGIRQKFQNLPVDKFIQVTEGAPDYRILERKAIKLRGEGPSGREPRPQAALFGAPGGTRPPGPRPPGAQGG